MKEEYVKGMLLEISPYTTLIQLKDCFGGIHHCVTVVGKWIFDSTLIFSLPLTKDNLEYCWINDNEDKGMNGYKVLLKAIGSITKENNKSIIQRWKFITFVW